MGNRIKNKKGEAASLLAMLGAIVVTVASSGALFTGGVSSGAGSGMFLAMTGLTAYSQMPHVTGPFREKKAVGYCEDQNLHNAAATTILGGIAKSDCVNYVASLSEGQIMDVIRDDNPGNYVQWSDMAPRLGSPKR